MRCWKILEQDILVLCKSSFPCLTSKQNQRGRVKSREGREGGRRKRKRGLDVSGPSERLAGFGGLRPQCLSLLKFQL